MTRRLISEPEAQDIGEARQEADHGPCRCQPCGPSPFEMRVAERRRALDLAAVRSGRRAA